MHIKYYLRWFSSKIQVLLWMLQQLHKLHQLYLGLLQAGHVAELDATALSHPEKKL